MRRVVPAIAALALVAAATTAARGATREPAITTGAMPRDPSRPAAWAWEPQLAQDTRGVLWAAGGHCPFVDQHGSCGPSPVGSPPVAAELPLWRSDDGGRSWRFVADALAFPPPLHGVVARPGSSDPDVAVAPKARPGRPPVVSAVSLYGATSALAVSADAGRTWAVAPWVGLPAQDRPWLAADGACDLYLEYTPIVDVANVAAVPRVERYDACALAAAPSGTAVAVPASSTLVEPAANAVTEGNQSPARLAVGRRGLYAAFLACDASDRCGAHVAISRDRGVTWDGRDLPGPLVTFASDGTFPVSAAADGSGRVAVVATDTRHVRLWLSDDDGRTWRARPSPVDAGLGWTMANVPTLAVRGKVVAVAWYASPPAAPGAAQRWSLVVARSTDGGATFAYAVVPPVLATTPHGVALRDALYDDFGAQVTPDGAVAVVYTQSCADHRPDDRACPGPPGPGAPGTFDVVRWARIAPAR